ncbi:MAG: ABC transporter permease [Ruminococcus sp.]|jgi:ABC-2 type transport system permease protein|nr:ABC transporter permease [Ruminococcus sp.]
MQFRNLLKKELRELFTLQVIMSMLTSVVLLVLMGQMFGGAVDSAEEQSGAANIAVVDTSNPEFMNQVMSVVEQNLKVSKYNVTSDDYASELKRLEIDNLVVIPEGFAESILNGEPGKIDFISTVKVGGLTSSLSTITSSASISVISHVIQTMVLSGNYGLTETQINTLWNNVVAVEYATFDGKIVNASAEEITGNVMMQMLIAPLVIFFLLFMASQMIMTAISTEKIDKTLETLLSAPVSRLTLLFAKLLAAIIAALANAAAMTVGMFFYMDGLSGGIMGELTGTAGDAMSQLGLSLGVMDYILFGVQLFFTIAIGLGISLILGALATDIKSVQSLLMTMMMVILVPFAACLIADVNAMSPLFKTIMYLIPFTHSYMAIPNLMTGQMALFWFGLIYQIIFFAVVMYFAVKMFTSDKLFTMSFDFSNRRQRSDVRRQSGK